MSLQSSSSTPSSSLLIHNENDHPEAESEEKQNSLTDITIDDDPVFLRHRCPNKLPLSGNNDSVEPSSLYHDVPGINPNDSRTFPQRRKDIWQKIHKNNQQFVREYFLWDIVSQFQNGWKNYSSNTFRKDVIAGVAVAIMAIPLSMSYAKLAGMPPYYGLYASFVPPIVYPLLATSRQLAVGPAALVCLVLSSGLTEIMEKQGFNSEQQQQDDYIARYTQLSIQCSFLVGILYIAMGLFRLGFVTQFLSRALISGFTTGAALIIIVSQLKYLFGYNIPASDRIVDIIRYIIQDINKFNWKTFVMGVGCMCIVIVLRKVSQMYSKYSWIQALGPLTVAVLSISLTAGLNLEEKGVPTVHFIPSGLPSVTVKDWFPLSMDIWVRRFSIISCYFPLF
jgi:sulfate transporter 4